MLINSSINYGIVSWWNVCNENEFQLDAITWMHFDKNSIYRKFKKRLETSKSSCIWGRWCDNAWTGHKEGFWEGGNVLFFFINLGCSYERICDNSLSYFLKPLEKFQIYWKVAKTDNSHIPPHWAYQHLILL